MKQYIKPVVEILEIQPIQNIALNPYDAVISNDGKSTIYQVSLMGNSSIQNPI